MMIFSTIIVAFLFVVAVCASGETWKVTGALKSESLSRSALGWGLVEVSPKAFLSVVYKGTFRVNIYRQENVVDPLRAQYYYSPALIIDPTSAVCDVNNFNKRFEVRFSVIMWDQEFEDFVVTAINTKVGATVARDNVRTLPIESIRLETSEFNEDYEVMNQWTSYASQPATVDFRLRFLDFAKCNQTAINILRYPKEFTTDLVVYYSLQTQRSARRRIQIKAEHVQNGNLFSSLEQKLPDKGIVYLRTDDVKRLTQEIATEVIASEVTDEEFVSQDQSLTVSNLLTTLLAIRQQSTEGFDEQMWNSVFWNEDNARPDKVTSTLNDLFEKSNEKIHEIVKKEVATDDSVTVSASLKVKLVEANIATTVSNKKLTKDELDNLYELLKEHKNVTQWSGEAFTPKPLQLSRTNLAALRATGTISTVQVSVTKTVSELSTRINILDSSASVSAMALQRNEIFQMRTELAQQRGNMTLQGQQIQLLESKQPSVGTIRMVHSTVVPDGWLRCDGSAIDCTRYRGLCNVVGSTTPDFRGRFPVMRNGHSYATSLGEKGGEAAHTLTVAEMPSHSHTMPTGHLRDNSYSTIHKFVGHEAWARGPQFQTEYAGSSQSHNNLPPFLTVEFIIKT